MAGRPTKQTVDYFPHYCRHGKTMIILEQKYGNDGYAFWFKLLELLGDTDGHQIDFNDPIAWEFFLSKVRLPEETCNEILNLLSKLKAIDADLWKDRIIWCDNFVQGISDAYRNRVVEIPLKPDIKRKKLPDKPISDVRNSHSRVEESRGENTLVRNSSDSDNGFEKFWNIYPKKVGKKAALQAYRKAKGKPSVDRLIQIIQRQRQSEMWQKEDGQYIPNPATWLNQGRWDDVLETRNTQFSGPCPTCKCKPCICGRI